MVLGSPQDNLAAGLEGLEGGEGGGAGGGEEDMMMVDFDSLKDDHLDTVAKLQSSARYKDLLKVPIQPPPSPTPSPH